MSSSSVCRRAAHVALIPSAGMGHLAPFCRLAVALSDGGYDPTISAAESDRISALFASFPRIRPLLLHLPPLHPSEFPPSADPFYLRYILFTTSASMLALYTYFPTYLDAAEPGSPIGDIDIPGLWRVPRASVVPALHDADNLFTIQFVSNGRALPQADGIIVNTFDGFELEALAALRAGKVTPSLPPVIAVGPLHPLGGSKSATPLLTRTAMSKAQIQQLRRGIEVSGVRFLWVVKGKAVDREDDSEVEQLVGGDDEQFL
ncbi:UDP-glycosyltransferase [Ananas comosus]|uniref:UDP-glycosyltransferase n=1 Tax=Ananas comosus TaxID=4615 RepID=A0A199V8B9_ANACO|nr:UDP-glycosyltransferase [Ananas comosus]